MTTTRRSIRLPVATLLLASLAHAPPLEGAPSGADPEPRVYLVKVDNLADRELELTAICLGDFGTSDRDLAPNVEVKMIHRSSDKAFSIARYEALDSRVGRSQAYIYKQKLAVDPFWPAGAYDLEMRLDRAVTDKSLANNVKRVSNAFQLRSQGGNHGLKPRPPAGGTPLGKLPTPAPGELKPAPRPPALDPEQADDPGDPAGCDDDWVVVHSINQMLKGKARGQRRFKLSVRAGDRVTIQAAPAKAYRKHPVRLIVTQADGSGEQKFLLEGPRRLEFTASASGLMRIELRRMREGGAVYLRADASSH